MSTTHSRPLHDRSPVSRVLRQIGLGLVLAATASLTSCNWLLNEAFIWDVPAPPVEVPDGVTPGS